MYKYLHLILSGTLIIASTFGQNEPIIIEAESGTLGADYEIQTNSDVTYISPKTNFISASNPGSADKTASFIVTSVLY